MKLSERVANKDFRAPAPELMPSAYATEPEPFYRIDGREVKHLASQIAKLEEQLRAREEQMERLFSNLPKNLKVYLQDMGEFDADGRVKEIDND